MADQPDDVEVEDTLPDPGEPLPVIRHHLHETLLAVNDAATLVGSLDLADAQRHGKRYSSPLASRLSRIEGLLSRYLGYDDEPEDYGDVE